MGVGVRYERQCMQKEEWDSQRVKWFPNKPREGAWRTVRVFISSTFNDMHGERDSLTRNVFTALNQRCRSRRVVRSVQCRASVAAGRAVPCRAVCDTSATTCLWHGVCTAVVWRGVVFFEQRVLPVDLRWGLTAEDTSDSGLGALEHCFLEIDQSRPFFITLCGERYGWCPPHYR